MSYLLTYKRIGNGAQTPYKNFIERTSQCTSNGIDKNLNPKFSLQRTSPHVNGLPLFHVV